MSLNIARVQGRLTHAVFGALNAFHSDRLPASFFEPIAATKREAEDMAFDWKAAKNVARAVAGKPL